MTARRLLGILLITMLTSAVGAGAAPPPITVSPGSPDQIAAVETSCPTFSWSLSALSESYELVVAALDDSGLSSRDPNKEPVIHAVLPAGISSWTPPGAHCLTGGTYAWYVRTVGETGAGAWSQGLAFEVLASPQSKQVELLLERIEALESRQAPQSPAWPSHALSASVTGILPAEFDPPPVQAVPELAGPAAIKATNPVSSTESYGILGVSQAADRHAAGVAGENTVTTGRTVGVLGIVHANEGAAVKGINFAETSSGTNEWATGVSGHSRSPQGVGVNGTSEASTGQNAGVAGDCKSPDGWGGFFINTGAGSLIAATNNAEDLSTLEFEVKNDGTTHIGASLALKPLAGPPITCSAATEGFVYFRSGTDKLCYCSDTSGWAAVDGSVSPCS